MELCRELKENHFFFFFKQRAKRGNIKNGWEQTEQPLSFPLSPAISSHKRLPQSTVAEQNKTHQNKMESGSRRRCGIFVEGRGDFSRQNLEFKLFLAGLFWAELQRRIKQRETNPGPSLPLRSLPSPRVQ